MRDNLTGELRLMKDFGIKPNFSSLSRTYGHDRHTIKKYYDNNGIPPRKKSSRESKWDKYYDEIFQLMKMKNITKKSVYMFLFNKYGEQLPGSYDSFKSYTLRKNIKFQSYNDPHVLYEVEPGSQLQVDWKEDLSIHLKNGTEIHFNVFSATLGYSREHIFIYSSSKTTADFIRCMIEAFRRLGGITKEVLTDNMSAIVSVNGNSKTIQPKVRQLFKDLNCNLRLCKVKTPQTKGKTENSNKFVKWVFPYDYSLESEDDLIHLIEDTITSQSNMQINSSTKLPPATLFKKEKEYLNPLPSKILLESYIEEHYRQKVPSTLLITYRGNKYSVPPAYIDKIVNIHPTGDSIYIYHNKELVTKHTISQKSVNYNEKHYKESLQKTIKNKEIDIETVSKENLRRLENLVKC